MRLYELTFIVHPDADEEQQDAIKQRIGDIASQNGGEVVSVRDWGHRKLAYPIRKHSLRRHFRLAQFGKHVWKRQTT